MPILSIQETTKVPSGLIAMSVRPAQSSPVTWTGVPTRVTLSNVRDSRRSALTAIRATGFVDAAAAKGLSTPELAATIKFDEGKKEEKVALAKSGADGFASRAGEPGAAKVDASAIDAVTKALQELK